MPARMDGRSARAAVVRGPGYDRLPERRFEFVPLWGMAVYFVYALRRVDCPTLRRDGGASAVGGGKVSLDDQLSLVPGPLGQTSVLGGGGHASSTPPGGTSLSRSNTRFSGASSIRISSSIEAIGVDEIQWQRGHHYLTLVYQIEDGMKRLLWVARERTEDSLRGFFRTLSDESRQSIRFVCSDMWQPYLNVIAEQLQQAVHVLDRFHIMKKMNEAIDEVRRSEAARLERGRLRAGAEAFALVSAQASRESARRSRR